MATRLVAVPYAPEVYRLPFPNHYRYGDGLSEAAFVERELGRFRESLINTVAAEQVAAVIAGSRCKAKVDSFRCRRLTCRDCENCATNMASC